MKWAKMSIMSEKTIRIAKRINSSNNVIALSLDIKANAKVNKERPYALKCCLPSVLRQCIKSKIVISRNRVAIDIA